MGFKSFLITAGIAVLLSTVLVAQPLMGNYTIGSGGNYTNFTSAVADLNNNGVIGPVVFNVMNGTYTEQISLGEIGGASSNNTITFQSMSGINTDVTLHFASSNTFSEPNYVVQLNGSDYIVFQNITIQRTGSNLYARVVDFSGDASNNVFNGNHLLGRAGATNDNGAVVYSGDANAGNMDNTFTNNIIQDGHAGIWWESTSGNSKSGLTVSGNTFSNYRYGVILNYVNDILITGNSITNAASFNSAQTKGIDCFRCEQDMAITKNNIVLTDASSNYGIDLQASVGSVSEVGNVSNNMIAVGGSGTSNGINSGSLTSYKNYYFNSVRTSGTNATSSSAYYQNGSNNINLKNNVFVATAGNAVEILAPISGLLSSDYNDFYTLGVAVANWGGTNAADLSAWQNLTPAGFDVNSVSADPQFVSSTDLHASGLGIQDAAMPITGITDDIDGDARNPVYPDIGADEFSFGSSCNGFMITSVSAFDVTCNGLSDGTITITVVGGYQPIESSLDSGLTWQPTVNYLSLGPGSYDVLVKDDISCIVSYGSNPVVIAEPQALSLSFSVTHETVVGTNDGSIDLTVGGGNGGNTFLWSDLETTEDLNSLPGGVYCVTVTDSKNCTITDCDTVQTLSPGCQGFIIDDVVKTNISCNGVHDGEIKINYSGGTAPISFSIDSGKTWQTNNGTFSGLGPAKYFIFIMDSNNCQASYANNPVIITEPAAFNPTITQDGNALMASTGSSYQWFLDGNPIAGAVSQKYTAKESGQYYVRVTVANGCAENSPVLDVVISSIDGQEILDKLLIYPNPTDEALQVQMGFSIKTPIAIVMSELSGKIVKRVTVNSAPFILEIDVKNLPGGIYFLQIKWDNNTLFRKVVKTK